jgi:hypothetical protein
VVYCAVHLSGGQRQEQVMDAATFSWRIRFTVTGLFSEARFAGDLTGREDSTPYAVTSVARLAVNADQRR